MIHENNVYEVVIDGVISKICPILYDGIKFIDLNTLTITDISIVEYITEYKKIGKVYNTENNKHLELGVDYFYYKDNTIKPCSIVLDFNDGFCILDGYNIISVDKYLKDTNYVGFIIEYLK